MSRLHCTLVAAAVFAVTAAAASPAEAQVKLTMRSGVVTLDATNVSVRQILVEWARVGRVAVVNGEKVAGTAVTLQLTGVSERQALDTILRGVAGYLVSARPGTPDPTQALFDKVVILPTSAAPPPQAPGPGSMAGRQPVFQPAPPMPDADDGFDEDPDLQNPQTPAFQPGGGSAMPRPMPGNGAPIPAAVPPVQPGGLPRYQVPSGGYPPQLLTPQSGTPGSFPGPGRGPGPGQVAPVSPFGTMPAGAPGSVTPVPQGVPLSPTNPGVLYPSGTGPATR